MVLYKFALLPLLTVLTEVLFELFEVFEVFLLGESLSDCKEVNNCKHFDNKVNFLFSSTI